MAHQPKGSKHSQVVLDCNQTVSTVVLSQETDVENKIISVNTNGGSCKSATAGQYITGIYNNCYCYNRFFFLISDKT